jgi:hypothetical protein
MDDHGLSPRSLRSSILGFLKDLTRELTAQGLVVLKEEEFFDVQTSSVLKEKVGEWKGLVDEVTYKGCEQWFGEVVDLDQELRLW